MIKLLVLPEVVYDQYKVAGVQLTKLICPNYMVSVSSLADLVDIQSATVNYPFDFGDTLPIVKELPIIDKIAELVENDLSGGLLLKDVYQRLKQRQSTVALLPDAMEESKIHKYKLINVDENFWVVVQTSVYRQTNDPVQTCIKLNSSLFDSMLEVLDNVFPFEKLAASILFENYLSSIH